jgi:homoserine O-acetyltransferase/O-succinyltransferase
MRHALLSAMACLLLIGSLPAAVAAHGPGDPPHQLYQIGDFKLESGEVIKDFAISYATHGTLNAKKSNAILMVTALSGNHHRLGFLIGPGKALDTTKYFIVATDAIGNGLTTSPSNSTAQPRMKFPRFAMRDMVQSQYKLLKDKPGIDHVVTVIGPSMGGMQALQWGVSYPEFMDSLVALVPLARTPAWSVVIVDASRKAIMLDPAWKGGEYTSPPLMGTTPGMNGDYVKALRSIKAKTLIMTGVRDLLNPEWEPLEAAKYIRDVRTVTISPDSITGHFAAGGFLPADVDQINGEVERILDIVTQRGTRLKQ